MHRAARSAPLLLLALASCVPILEGRIRTRVLADGTTFRDTTWTKIRRGGDDEDEKRWNARPIAEDLARGVGRGFPSVETTDDRMKLSGVFRSPHEVPVDFRRDVPVLDAASTRQIEFRREDLLFGAHYLYRETFVDAIEPPDEKEARRELLRFVRRLVKRGAELELGRAYALDRFDVWVDETLGPVLEGILDLYWREKKRLGERDPHTGETGADRLLKRALERIRRLGLDLSPDADDERNAAAAQAWLCRLLAETVRPKADNARPPRPGDFRYLFPADDPWSGLRVARDRLAAADFGSNEALERELQRRLYALTGTFGSPPAEAEFRFDCALELPGLLLRTNGFLESGDTSFWRFTGEDLFPHGFVMEAESVVLDSPLLGRLRDLKPTLDRRDAVDLIRALKGVDAEDRARMKELLETAARHGTIEALAPDPEKEGDEQRVKKLEEVLEVVRRE
ncbi:MAG: hypothetical protein ACF8XB_05365 [Planctomycetota bacterium JB042]